MQLHLPMAKKQSKLILWIGSGKSNVTKAVQLVVDASLLVGCAVVMAFGAAEEIFTANAP
jgi:hypothetical protein